MSSRMICAALRHSVAWPQIAAGEQRENAGVVVRVAGLHVVAERGVLCKRLRFVAALHSAGTDISLLISDSGLHCERLRSTSTCRPIERTAKDGRDDVVNIGGLPFLF